MSETTGNVIVSPSDSASAVRRSLWRLTPGAAGRAKQMPPQRLKFLLPTNAGKQDAVFVKHFRRSETQRDGRCR